MKRKDLFFIEKLGLETTFSFHLYHLFVYYACLYFQISPPFSSFSMYTSKVIFLKQSYCIDGGEET